MTLFRGFGGDLPLMRWLREVIWPIEAKLEPEDVYWGTRLACLEMIRTGTARFWDMYWHPGATARAVTRRRPAGDDRRSALRRRRRHRGDAGDRTGQPRGARRLRTADRRGARPPLDLHGQRGTAALDRRAGRASAGCRSTSTSPRPSRRSWTASRSTGCVPPSTSTGSACLNERTILAHGVWLDGEELALIAERGCTVVTNPVANMKLAVGGVFPYPAARDAGVAVGLGTDGPGSNDSLDLFSDLKLFALAQRHAAGDPPSSPPRRPGQIATGGASPLCAGHVESGGRRTSCCCDRLARAQPRRPLLGPRLRGERLDRRHHRGRRTGADAQRRGGRARKRSSRVRSSARGDSASDLIPPILYPPGVCYGERMADVAEHDRSRG